MIYFIQAGESGPIKIGVAQDPCQRLYDLQTGHYERLRFIGLMDGERKNEKQIHATFADFRLNREWFRPVPEVLDFVSKNTYLPSPEKFPVVEQQFLVNEVAQMLGKTSHTIRRWIKGGLLKAAELPGRYGKPSYLIAKSEVEKFGVEIKEEE